MTLKYLVTGATGGLGKQILAYLVANVPASEYAAASSNEANRKHFEDQGIAFRVVNYDDPASMEKSFQDVENLLFVSTNTFDVEKRRKQHQSFVDAAKKVDVKHVSSSPRVNPNPLRISESNILYARSGIHHLPLADSAPTRKRMFNKLI